MTKKYTLIYADPPWTFRDKATDGQRGASFKYPVMSLLDICRLPVWELAAENCLLAMWWVPTQPLEALKVVEAWGFRLVTMKGLTWNKCGKRQTDKLVMGMGSTTRANSEDCLFAVKGNLPERINAGIIQSFTAPRLDHSRKPDMAREKLVQLLGDVPRIELFAHHTSHGFDVWGNQCGTPSIEMVPGIVKFLEKTNERKNDVDKGITS
ncbi:adenine methylase [Escherichia coli]|nr:adenine methylase [Escherichia coli]